MADIGVAVTLAAMAAGFSIEEPSSCKVTPQCRGIPVLVEVVEVAGVAEFTIPEPSLCKAAQYQAIPPAAEVAACLFTLPQWR